MYLQIERKKVKRRAVRGIVLGDDISNISEVESNFNERDLRIEAVDMRPRRGLF